MSTTDERDDAALEQDAAMKRKLDQDVASWATARAGGAVAGTDPVVDRAAIPRPAKVVKARVAKAPAPMEVPAVKKPYSMAYEGVTSAQHIQKLIVLRNG